MKPDPNIRIGNQTAFAAASVLEPFEFAVAQKFTAFEFFPDRGGTAQCGWDEQDLSHATRRAIKETATANKITLTVHAPLEFNPLKESEDGRLYSTIEFAHDIGAELLNLHLDTSMGAEQFIAALGPGLRLTAEAGLKLALENTVWTGPEDFNHCFSILWQHGDLPFAHAGMTFDLGHANLFEPMRNDYWRYLDKLGPQVPLLHLHLHENFGDRDNHLTLFTGPSRADAQGITGMADRLLQRNYQGCAILEQWPQPPSLLTSARDRLRDLWGERQQHLSLFQS